MRAVGQHDRIMRADGLVRTGDQNSGSAVKAVLGVDDLKLGIVAPKARAGLGVHLGVGHESVKGVDARDPRERVLPDLARVKQHDGLGGAVRQRPYPVGLLAAVRRHAALEREGVGAQKRRGDVVVLHANGAKPVA